VTEKKRKATRVQYVRGFPRIADPHIFRCDCGKITARFHHVGRQLALLQLVLVLTKSQPTCPLNRLSWKIDDQEHT
jgi:hypothetical protein